MRTALALSLAACSPAADDPVEADTSALARGGGTIRAPAASDDFGANLASVGDLDGDGRAELAIRARDTLGWQFGGQQEVWVFPGDPATPALELHNPYVVGSVSTPSSWIGEDLAGAGDVNGDGWGDLLVADAVNGDDGQVLVWHGGPGGPSSTPDLQILSGGDGEFGYDVSPLGDVDGDGYDDVALGSRWDIAVSMGGGSWYYPGAVYLHLGGPAGLSATADRAWTGVLVPGLETDERIGDEVAGIGDVNGDGFADLAMQGTRRSVAEGGTGNVHVYYGSAGGFGAAPDLIVDDGDPAAPGFLGERIVALGDADGDGYADVAFGTALFESRYQVHRGGPGGLDPVALQTIVLADEADLVALDDATGDGHADVAWLDPATGDVCLYLGGPTGIDAAACARTWPAVGAALSGWALGGRPALAIGDPDAGHGVVRAVGIR